jgi:hypothetical protein
MKDEMYVILIIAFILGFFLSHISSNLVEGVMGEGDAWCKGNARDRASSDHASQYCPAITPGGPTVPCPAADGAIIWPQGNKNEDGSVVNGFGMDETGMNLYALVLQSVNNHNNNMGEGEIELSLKDYLEHPVELSNYEDAYAMDHGEFVEEGWTREDLHRASSSLGVPGAVWKHETCNPDKSDLPPNCKFYQNANGTEGGGYWFLHSLCPVDTPTPPTSKLTCGTDVNGKPHNYACPDGDKLKPNPTKITCKGVDCTDEECCNTPSPTPTPTPTPTPSPSSPLPICETKCTRLKDKDKPINQSTSSGDCTGYGKREDGLYGDIGAKTGTALRCRCPNTMGGTFKCAGHTGQGEGYDCPWSPGSKDYGICPEIK